MLSRIHHDSDMTAPDDQVSGLGMANALERIDSGINLAGAGEAEVEAGFAVDLVDQM